VIQKYPFIFRSTEKFQVMFLDATITNQNQIYGIALRTAVLTMGTVFWDTTPCILVNSYGRFGEAFWLHILGLISARRVDYSGREYGGTKLIYTSVATN
jgi:hypothetical protein